MAVFTLVREILPPYGDLWKVARVDVHDFSTVTATQREELFGWLESIGVPFRDCRPELVVTQNAEDGRLLLHLTRYPDGDRYIDHAANRVHTVPLVFVIDGYPAWLVQASHIQDQIQKGQQ